MERLKQFTLDEKIDWLSGRDLWHAFGLERLDLPPLLLADGPHGVRVYSDIVKKVGQHIDTKRLLPSTMFPSAVAMASTFNEELIFEAGKTIGKECNMFGVDILLAPGINLKRSPLGGRNFEYYSEDPVLTTQIGTAFVKGVQSEGVGATIKHFAFNEQETQRRFVNTIIEERTAHELYLKPFYEIIKKANPYCIMTSYNQVNGEYTTESKWLLDILRNKWNYKGLVMSDWGGVQDKVKSIKVGTNLEMPGVTEFRESIVKAIAQKELSEDEIDQALLPALKLYDKLNQNKNKYKKTSLEDNHNIAKKVAEQSIVLLKNNDCLPLHINNIGVVGEFAEIPRVNGGGSVTLKPFLLETPLHYVQQDFTVDYAKGYHDDTTSQQLIEAAIEVTKNNDVVVFFTGTTKQMDNEGQDKPNMSLPKVHIELYKTLRMHAKKLIVVLNNGSPLDLRELQDCDALIEAWFLGSANGEVISDLLTGKLNPSGRLSETIPLSLENTPYFKTFPSINDDVHYCNDIINLGYRYYDTHHYPVMYPFGYGLSYSSFQYEKMNVSSQTIDDDTPLTVTVTITNTSNTDGYEVVQLYINDVESYYPRPYKELKQFKKVFIKALETEEISFTLTEDDFSIYAVDFNEFRVEEGRFKIMIGKNVNEIVLSEEIYYKTGTVIHNRLTKLHPVTNFMLYKKDIMDEIIKKYRDFPWYEREEPMIRVMNRLKTQFSITDNDFDTLIKRLTAI